MQQILSFVQIIISLLLIVSILLQNKGAGLSGAFGGGDFGGYYTKRGMEKFLSRATVALAIIFISLSIINLFLAK